jgi:hypothetical protein
MFVFLDWMKYPIYEGAIDSVGNKPSVVYQGIEVPGWGHNLPSAPGIDYSGAPNQKCY